MKKLTHSIVVHRIFVNNKNRFCVERIDRRIYVDWTLFAALAERYKVSYLFFNTLYISSAKFLTVLASFFKEM